LQALLVGPRFSSCVFNRAQQDKNFKVLTGLKNPVYTVRLR
jgi:hypothetical protein